MLFWLACCLSCPCISAGQSLCQYPQLPWLRVEDLYRVPLYTAQEFVRWAIYGHLRVVQLITDALASYRPNMLRQLEVPLGEPRTGPPHNAIEHKSFSDWAETFLTDITTIVASVVGEHREGVQREVQLRAQRDARDRGVRKLQDLGRRWQARPIRPLQGHPPKTRE